MCMKLKARGGRKGGVKMMHEHFAGEQEAAEEKEEVTVGDRESEGRFKERIEKKLGMFGSPPPPGPARRWSGRAWWPTA